jgi:hypothetical protein
MKIAVLVYSNTGNTRRVADAIAARIGIEVAVLVAPQVRPSAWSILRLGYATLFGGTTPVELRGPDPTRADLLVLAAPVWAGRLSVPMRSWLATRPRLPARVALVMTGGAPVPAANTFGDFAKHAGVTPVARLYVSEAEVKADAYSAACDRFCTQLDAGQQVA